MKKITRFILLLFFFLLVGCSENTTEVYDSPDKEIDIKNVPIDLTFYGNEQGAFTLIDAFCWEEDEKKCNLVKPEDPEALLLEHNQPILKVNAGSTIGYNVSINGEKKFPSDFLKDPDYVDVTQIKSKQETKIEIQNQKFTAPTEKGKYFYIVHAKWEGKYKGEAYYVFSLFVR